MPNITVAKHDKAENSCTLSELKFCIEMEGLLTELDMVDLFWDHVTVFKGWPVHLTAFVHVS